MKAHQARKMVDSILEKAALDDSEKEKKRQVVRVKSWLADTVIPAGLYSAVYSEEKLKNKTIKALVEDGYIVTDLGNLGFQISFK